MFDNATDTFSVADLASLGNSQESDAIQLWSYGFLALLDPDVRDGDGAPGPETVLSSTLQSDQGRGV